MKKDMVNSPPHYQSDTGVECIDAIRAALGPEGFRAYLRGTSMKYLWREKWDVEEDAKKTAWYVNKLVEQNSDRVLNTAATGDIADLRVEPTSTGL